MYKTTDGYEFIVEACEHIWECDYRTLVIDLHNKKDNGTTLSSTNLLKTIVSKSAYYTPLSARDAFVGGRTENFYLQWTKQDKIITVVKLTFVLFIPTLTQTVPAPMGNHRRF